MHKTVQLVVKGKPRRYLLQISNGAITGVHRVMPTSQWRDGRFVGEWNDYRSISRNSKGYAELVAELQKQCELHTISD